MELEKQHVTSCDKSKAILELNLNDFLLQCIVWSQVDAQFELPISRLNAMMAILGLNKSYLLAFKKISNKNTAMDNCYRYELYKQIIFRSPAYLCIVAV